MFEPKISLQLVAKKAVWICALILCSTSSFGQGLDIIGRVKADGAGLANTKVVVMKDGKKVRTLTSGLAKFEMRLKFNSTYLLVFEKKGYVTKKLEFSTAVPDGTEEKMYHPFAFTVNLFEQYDDVNIVVFNQPVGKIRYEDGLEEFDYDTDYTKSIQSQLDEAMKAIEAKKKEMAKQAKKDAKEKEKQDALAAKREIEEQKRREAEAKKREEEREKAEAEAKRREEERNKELAKQEKEKPVEEEVLVQNLPEPDPTPKPTPEPVKEKPKPKYRFVDPGVAKMHSGDDSRQTIQANEGFEPSPVRMADAIEGQESAVIEDDPLLELERIEDVIVEKKQGYNKDPVCW